MNRKLDAYELKSGMTFILGARASNGVVLLADTKFTIDEGSDEVYDDKIIGEFYGILMGFAGVRRTFELFRAEIIDYVKDAQARNKIIPMDKFLLKASAITHNLSTRYGQNYDVLIGIRGGASILKHMYADGGIEPVNQWKTIGSGSPFGKFYLKKYWHQSKTMEDVAELGYFIIKYIEEFGLDLSVGVGDNKSYPQIKFLPDGASDREPTALEMQKFEKNARNKLEKIRNEPFIPV